MDTEQCIIKEASSRRQLKKPCQGSQREFPTEGSGQSSVSSPSNETLKSKEPQTDDITHPAETNWEVEASSPVPMDELPTTETSLCHGRGLCIVSGQQ